MKDTNWQVTLKKYKWPINIRPINKCSALVISAVKMKIMEDPFLSHETIKN